MLTTFLLIFGVIMIVNGIFTFRQTRLSVDVYEDLRKKGRLIIGEKRFLVFFVQYVVAFAVSDNGKIKEAVRIKGMLPFQKVKKEGLPYTGNKFASLNPYQAGVDEKTARVVENMIRKNA